MKLLTFTKVLTISIGNGDSGKQLAVGTGQYEDINCGCVLCDSVVSF